MIGFSHAFFNRLPRFLHIKNVSNRHLGKCAVAVTRLTSLNWNDFDKIFVEDNISILREVMRTILSLFHYYTIL